MIAKPSRIRPHPAYKVVELELQFTLIVYDSLLGLGKGLNSRLGFDSSITNVLRTILHTKQLPSQAVSHHIHCANAIQLELRFTLMVYYTSLGLNEAFNSPVVNYAHTFSLSSACDATRISQIACGSR